MTNKGRKPLPNATTVPVTVNKALLAADNAVADQLIELKAGYSDERDLANQLLGQAQMADSLSKFTQTVSISKLAYVKEHKLYKALKGKKIPHGAEFSVAAQGGDAEKTPHGAEFLSGTWAEYCSLLGKSEDQIDRDIANLQAFGEAALESMSAMGIGYRDLRQYRRLPADEQQALIEVAKAGDKDGFLDLAETLVARHASEKKTLEGKLEAKDKVLADKAERINKLESDLDAATTLTAPKLPTAALDAATAAALSAMVQLLPAVDALMQVGDEGLQLRARQSVEFLVQQLAGLCDQFNIQVDLDGCLPPPWLDAAAIAALEERDAQQAATKAGKKSKKTEG